MFEDLFANGGLSFERLNTLLKLSEAGSLIKAAKNDIGQQSRLSHHLRELSEFFGVELTERAGKSIRLTPAGKSLVQLAREHFLELQAFRNQTAKIIPTLRIAAGDSITQSLLVPAIGRIRRPSSPIRFKFSNLRTKDIVQQLIERRVDFGLLRSDAIKDPLQYETVFEQRYAIFVPKRLVPSRGLMTIKNALLECPHAAIGGDGQMTERLKELARKSGGEFIPELICDSIGQCVSAVETGAFAAILPVQSWVASSETDYLVVEDESLDILSRQIVLAWHPRTIDIMGSSALKTKAALTNALQQQGASADKKDEEL
jgi:DNA-binding transcriptional LysR family regulator